MGDQTHSSEKMMTDQQVLPPRRKRSVLADMVSGIGFGQPPRISIKGGRFSIVDTAGNALPANFVDQQLGYYLDIVICDANPAQSKIFFGRDYQDGDDSPPACFSDNGVGPSSNASQPQAQSCAVCPNNMIGSAVSRLTGDGIKACRDQKKLAAFVVGAPVPDEIYLLVVTPGTLKNMRAYAGTLDRNGQDPADVVTRVYFAAGQTGVLNFVAVSEIDQTMDARLERAAEDGRTDAIVGRNDVARPAGAPLPAIGHQGAPALPPPQPPPHQFQPSGPTNGTYQPPPQAFVAAQQPQQAPPPPATTAAPATRRRGRAAAAPPPPQQAPVQHQQPTLPVAPFVPRAAPPAPAGFHQDNGGIPAGLERQAPAAGFGAAPGGHVQPPPPAGAPGGAPQAGYGMVNTPAPVADPRTQEALRNAFGSAATPPPPRPTT